MVSRQLIEAGVSAVVYEAIMGHSYLIGLREYAQADLRRVDAAAALLVPPAPRGQRLTFPKSGKQS
jgi:hypothetical protein